MSQSLLIISNVEEEKGSQELCKRQLRDLDKSYQDLCSTLIQGCINQQIEVLSEISNFIIKKTEKLDAWEHLIYDIVKESETHQQRIQIINKNKIDSKIFEQLQSDYISKANVLEKKICFKRLDFQKQKKSHLDSQIQSLKTVLMDMEKILKQKKENTNEYLIKYFQDKKYQEADVKSKKELTEDQREFNIAYQICMNDLYQEFDVDETQQDNGNQYQNDTYDPRFFSLIQKGLKLMRNEKYDQAELIFDEALKFDPNNPKALHCKANSISLQHEQVRAQDYYQQAIERDPNYELCYLNYVRNMYLIWPINQDYAYELLQQIKQKFPNCKKLRFIEKIYYLRDNKQNIQKMNG